MGMPLQIGIITNIESQFTAGTFTNGFEITGSDTYHRRLMTHGAPLGNNTNIGWL
jgi:hypothetical protein